MRAPTTRRAGHRSADAGITLAELLVSMLIMSMVTLATVTLTVGMQRTDAGTVARTDDTTAAQYAFRVISRAVPYALRPAVFADVLGSPLLEAGDSRLAVVIQDPDLVAAGSVATDPAAGLLLVEVEVLDGTLVERRTALDGVGDGTALLDLLPLSTGCATRDCTTRVLVDGVESGTGFRYLDAEGAPTTLAADVRSVEVTLVVVTNANRQSVASTHRERIYLKND
ncbi:MAG TPA: prepilin-type N-terminal cleavage/methylation domain-containing protein [Cellulomonas sp.]